MKNHYRDILEVMGEPIWWDEYAVPRYIEFSPNESADIYAEEVALVEIRCQHCAAPFLVCFSRSHTYKPEQTIAWAIDNQSLSFGDPPQNNCCHVGSAMSSVTVQVREYWFREGSEWRRNSELEIPIRLEWFSEYDEFLSRGAV